MTYTRTTVVSDAVGGDSVKQGCLDLDTDLTLCFTHLNTVAASLSDKIPLAKKGAVGGVCDLDADGLIPVDRIPIVPISLLPDGIASPTGSIQFWPAQTAPAGWVECDGRWLDQTAYADLFAVIGGIYGSNSVKFRVPDLRGYFLRGFNHGAGIDPGASARTKRGDGQTGDKVGTVQASAIQSHTHTYATFGSRTPEGTQQTYLRPGSNQTSILSYSGAGESRPANVTVMYCIKT